MYELVIFFQCDAVKFFLLEFCCITVLIFTLSEFLTQEPDDFYVLSQNPDPVCIPPSQSYMYMLPMLLTGLLM